METFSQVSIPQQFHQYPYDTETDFLIQQTIQEAKRYLDADDNDNDSLQILRELLEEFQVKGHKVFEKLVSKNVPIERRLRETLHDFRGRKASDMLEKFAGKLYGGGVKENMNKERGVDVDISKLERFKVKTVNIIGSGVVKEEEQIEPTPREANTG